MKNSTAISIRVLTSADAKYFAPGLEILNRTQGRDLFGLDYLEKRTQDPKSRVFAAFDGDEIIGVGVAQIIDQFEWYRPFDSELVEKLKNSIVGSYSTLALSEKYQGLGIGQKISHERLQWLKEQSCRFVVGTSWVSGLKNTSDRVFEKMGFKPVKRIDDFFVKSSLERPFICPVCGEPPCQCAAIMYLLELHSL